MRGYFQQNLSWSLRSTTICTETLIEFHGNKVNQKRGKTEREKATKNWLRENEIHSMIIRTRMFTTSALNLLWW